MNVNKTVNNYSRFFDYSSQDNIIPCSAKRQQTYKKSDENLRWYYEWIPEKGICRMTLADTVEEYQEENEEHR